MKTGCCGFNPLFCTHFLVGMFVLFPFGAGMHFFYELSGCNDFVAIFCAVNESVYEHAKIMLFPILFWWCIVVAIQTTKIEESLNAGTCAIYSSLILLIIGNGISILGGFENLTYDITLFGVCILFGQTIGWIVLCNGPLFPRLQLCCHVLLIIILAVLASCTFHPPQWPYMFEDHRNHTYGRPEKCHTT
jgi:hypothetical protein